MPLDITFTLTDNDLAHFQGIVDAARRDAGKKLPRSEIEREARSLIDEARTGDLPEFIAERVEQLDVVLAMINDAEWRLTDEEIEAVLNALAYFSEADDVIPDHIPGLGFLDDAIYVEIVLKELAGEIRLYREFCDFRAAEEARRQARGEDIKVGREEWLADKRAALHAKMRKRRLRGGAYMRLF
jgi:uncharacterized membrane protein YkvA (DUF1232 family)